MLLPAPIVAEVGYLLAAKAGSHVEATFLRSVAAGDFVPVELLSEDYGRMAGVGGAVRRPPVGYLRRVGDRTGRASERHRGRHT